jgi:hypothetical protein
VRPVPLAAARGVWGARLLAEPGPALTSLGLADRPVARRVARAIGARHVAQAAVVVVLRPRATRRFAVVDKAHGLSMLALAAVSEPCSVRRRWAEAAAGEAAAWTLLSALG